MIDLYSIIFSILRRFLGCIFVVVSVICGILVIVGGGPPQPYVLGAEEGVEPGGPPPPSSIVDRAIFLVI